MNPNWPRWIFASACKAFNDRCPGLNMFIEGQERSTEKLSKFIEFRLDGPFFQETTRHNYKTNFEINILIFTVKSDSDFHLIYKMVGTVAAAFTEIPVYKYGDGDEDDGSLVACFTLVPSADIRESLRISHFGQIDPNKPILQASVEGHYFEYLKD